MVFNWRKSKQTIPQFFGYDNSPTWPLKEEFSKWMLTFYKPWRKSVDELKLNGSFSDGLVAYMNDPMFPSSIYFEILRIKNSCYKLKGLNKEEADDFIGAERHLTPTEEGARQNQLFEKAMDVHDNAPADENDDMLDIELALREEDMLKFKNEYPDYKWNTLYNDIDANWLNEYTKTYYEEELAKISGVNTGESLMSILIW